MKAKNLDSEVDITVMFMPVESALVAALETNGGLYREALDSGVIITTPSTLLALLRTCAMQWQQAKLNELFAGSGMAELPIDGVSV